MLFVNAPKRVFLNVAMKSTHIKDLGFQQFFAFHSRLEQRMDTNNHFEPVTDFIQTYVILCKLYEVHKVDNLDISTRQKRSMNYDFEIEFLTRFLQKRQLPRDKHMKSCFRAKNIIRNQVYWKIKIIRVFQSNKLYSK